MKDEILHTAWKNLNRNTKSTGFESLTIQQVEASGVDKFIRSVKKELEEGRYTADEVKRVEIPKRNGEKNLSLNLFLKLILKTVLTATGHTGLQNLPVLRFTNGSNPGVHII